MSQPSKRQVERRPVRDAPPELLFVILTLCFDPRELANHMTSAGVSVCACCVNSPHLFSLAVQAALEQADFAARIERLLDALHREMLDAADTLGLDALLDEWVEQSTVVTPRLAGRLWAVARSLDERATALGAWWSQKAVIDAIRGMA